MASSPKNASNSPGKAKKKDANLDFGTAARMLPLVRSIVTDVVTVCNTLDALAPEQQTLDEYRRHLNWTSRQRRYAIQDEVQQAEKALNAAVEELDALGVSLVDPQSGRVEFPTRVNGRSAAFSWQPGEADLSFWRYAGEELRRPIPIDWRDHTPRYQPGR